MFGERHYVRGDLGFDRPGKYVVKTIKRQTDLRPEGFEQAYRTSKGTDYSHYRKPPTKPPHQKLKLELAKAIMEHVA